MSSNLALFFSFINIIIFGILMLHIATEGDIKSLFRKNNF